jgi:hypothetical protein
MDCKTPELPDDKLKKYYTQERRKELKMVEEAEQETDDSEVTWVRKPAGKRKTTVSKPSTGSQAVIKLAAKPKRAKLVAAAVIPNAVLPVSSKAPAALPSVTSAGAILDEAELNRRVEERIKIFIKEYEESKKSQLAVIPPLRATSSSDTATASAVLVTPATPATNTLITSNSSSNGVSGELVATLSQQLPLRAASPVVTSCVLPSYDFSGALTQAVYNDRLMHSFELNALQRTQQLGTLLNFQTQQQQQQQQFVVNSVLGVNSLLK